MKIPSEKGCLYRPMLWAGLAMIIGLIVHLISK